MTEIKKANINRGCDNISGAKTIENNDSVTYEGKTIHFNDNTEIGDTGLVNIEEMFEESEV